MEKNQIVEKVYEIVARNKRNNIGLDRGDERFVRLLGGYNVRFEAIDVDWYGNLTWGFWMYKEGKEWRDYELRFIGNKFMKRWAEKMVDYALSHKL